MIRDYLKEDGRLRLLEVEEAYPGKARNLALQAAKTEWVAMTDAGTG